MPNRKDAWPFLDAESVERKAQRVSFCFALFGIVLVAGVLAAVVYLSDSL